MFNLGIRYYQLTIFRMYLNFDMIFPLVLRLVCDYLLVIVMGLSVSLTGTGRCGNAARSPCQAVPLGCLAGG